MPLLYYLCELYINIQKLSIRTHEKGSQKVKTVAIFLAANLRTDERIGKQRKIGHKT